MAKIQQEYMLYNTKGEKMATVLVNGALGVNAQEISEAQYRAGVAQEYVDAVKNASHQPTKANKA
jgi:hypothetical protein